MTQAPHPAFLVGLLGQAIQASRTPALHEREGAELGVRYIYRLIDIEKIGVTPEALPELVTAAERLGFNGLNITHPFKKAVIPLLSELSDDAQAVGAVNTLLLRDGKRIGHNTDLFGFYESFRRGFPNVKKKSVVQLGAGGAGSAVAHAALKLGIERLTIFDVEPSQAAQLASALSQRFGAGRAVPSSNLPGAMAEAEGLIHCTPTGMTSHPGLPLPPELLRPEIWVSEIVYFPLETELLRAAKSLGCRTLDGGGMAVFQAVEAFRLFTGLQPDPERMLRHFASM
jgi:shikimate dehydrogenase